MYSRGKQSRLFLPIQNTPWPAPWQFKVSLSFSYKKSSRVVVKGLYLRYHSLCSGCSSFTLCLLDGGAPKSSGTSPSQRGHLGSHLLSMTYMRQRVQAPITSALALPDCLLSTSCSLQKWSKNRKKNRGFNYTNFISHLKAFNNPYHTIPSRSSSI